MVMQERVKERSISTRECFDSPLIPIKPSEWDIPDGLTELPPLPPKIYLSELTRVEFHFGIGHLRPGDMISFGKGGQLLEHFGIVVKRDNVPCQEYCKELGKNCRSHWAHLVHLNGKGAGTSNFVSSTGDNCGYVTCTLLCDYIIMKEDGVRKHDYVRVFKSAKSSKYSGPEIQGRALANINRHIGFSATDGNCEHFARWCYEDEWTSYQKLIVRDKVALASSGVIMAGGLLSFLCPPAGLAVMGLGAGVQIWGANA